MTCKTTFRGLREEHLTGSSLSVRRLGSLIPGGPMRVKVASLFDNYSFEYANQPPGFYVTHDVDHDDDDENFESIGLGDFLIYNWMLLIIMPLFIPVQEKTIVLIGHIVSVQVGLWMTRLLGDYWECDRLPALPCSVVFVSFYTLLVDHFYGIL